MSRTATTSTEKTIGAPPPPPRGRAVRIIAVLAAIWFLVGMAGGSYQAKLA